MLKVGDKVKVINPEYERLKDEVFEVVYVWDDEDKSECIQPNGKGWFIEKNSFLKKV